MTLLNDILKRLLNSNEPNESHRLKNELFLCLGDMYVERHLEWGTVDEIVTVKLTENLSKLAPTSQNAARITETTQELFEVV
jgi:hypothetical protein